MIRRHRRRTAPLAALAGVALALTACAPGSSSDGGSAASSAAESGVKTDAAGLGNVTLTVWDQEVRGGQEKQMSTLISQFQQKYPNIKIKRVSRSFDDLTKTLRLAMSGPDAPDVVQANNTRSQMGQFVTAKQIISLDPWAKAYGWDTRYPGSVRAVSSYSPDGKTFGSGSLYGLPQVGEVVGVYYNAKKLSALGLQAPRTWDDFEKALAAAKAKGETPLMLGNLDKWPAVHVFGVVQGRYTDPKAIRTLGFGQPGGSWTDGGNVKAGQTLVDWAGKGYFNKGFNGDGYDPVWQKFGKGEGVFLIAGSWLQADLAKANKDIRFMLPPVNASGDTPVTTGGTGLPFAITSKAKNADAAAAYINFITSDDAMKVLADNGNMPVIDTAKYDASDALGKDIFTAFGQASSNDGLLPYLDWATPTMGDTIGASLQDMLAKKQTPQQAMETIGKDYTEFTKQ